MSSLKLKTGPHIICLRQAQSQRTPKGMMVTPKTKQDVCSSLHMAHLDIEVGDYVSVASDGRRDLNVRIQGERRMADRRRRHHAACHALAQCKALARSIRKCVYYMVWGQFGGFLASVGQWQGCFRSQLAHGLPSKNHHLCYQHASSTLPLQTQETRIQRRHKEGATDAKAMPLSAFLTLLVTDTSWVVLQAYFMPASCLHTDHAIGDDHSQY